MTDFGPLLRDTIRVECGWMSIFEERYGCLVPTPVFNWLKIPLKAYPEVILHVLN